MPVLTPSLRRKSAPLRSVQAGISYAPKQAGWERRSPNLDRCLVQCVRLSLRLAAGLVLIIVACGLCETTTEPRDPEFLGMADED